MSVAAKHVMRGQAARAYWFGLIARAGKLTAAASPQGVEDFKHELARSARCAFPVEGASCAMAANGFLELGRAFATAFGARRETLAPALREAAKALDGLLHAEATQLAQKTWLRGEIAD
jgi:hypothetical protein